MSLLVKDMLLTATVALSSVALVYVYYFAPHMGQYYILSSLGTLCISGLLFVTLSAPGKKLVSYFKASRAEIRKVVWPKQQEILTTTFAVGVAVVIFSILVSVLDSILVKFLSKIIG
jgi:preprotein translocase subunit SecE